MTSRVEHAALAFVAVAWSGVALAQEPPVPKPANDFAADRARRIARTIGELEADAKAVESFGHDDEFTAALERARGELGGKRWWKSADGMLPRNTLEGWLVWNRPQTGREKPAALDFELDGHPFAAIVDLAHQLESHDVEFLFVTFPTRVQLYPELLLPALDAKSVADPSRPRFRGMVGANTRFLLELAKAGVEVVDLAPAFVDQRFAADERAKLLYLHDNTHWTPRAAELAAKIVAERIGAMPWFTPGPAKEGVNFEVKRKVALFRGEGNGAAPDAPPEGIALNGVVPIGAPLQKDEAAVRASPIVVIGDSFSWFHDDNHAGFSDQLFRFTGWPIDVVAPAGGAEQACRDALRRRGDHLANKKVVIWLVQEALLLPSGLYKKLDLFN